MNNTNYNLPVIDMHAHVMCPHSLVTPDSFDAPTPENARFMVEMLERCGYTALCIPVVTLYDAEDLPCNPLALYAKCLDPARIYAFAGLRRDLDIARNAGMLDQLTELLAAGFDGVKMICKPNARRVWNVPIDHYIFDGFYGYLQEHNIPLLFHVGDPASFWDAEKISDFARQSGWYYGDDKDIPDLNGFYTEVENTLERFPGLRVIFAHFYMMSDNLVRAAWFMDRFPDICFDLTPGKFMYYDFTKCPDKTRDFFIKYQDRLLFGTDNIGVNGAGADAVMESYAEKVSFQRDFFEKSGDVSYWGDTLHGLGLPEDVCGKIYAGNFMRLMSNKPPKAVNIEAVIELCETYIPLAGGDENAVKTLAGLKDIFTRMQTL